ncbi:MAG TPA: DNA-directed RNA polymerase subunit beta [Mycobacteriales bacterium]|nr:DNA-directed RNA polymerase subunit beta [Mycobacteriales bacterium]
MTDPGQPAGERRPRPHVAADVERLAAARWHGEPLARIELAHATAAVVVEAGRSGVGPRTPDLLDLADTVGLDTLAELWREAADDSLPGVLWTLYLLRSWCREQGSALARWYAAGRGLAPVAEVVAGMADGVDPAAVRALADAVLTGAYKGDFAVALERAAAFFRIVALGRSEVAGDHERAAEWSRAERNVRTADALERAAAAWRDGTLR